MLTESSRSTYRGFVFNEPDDSCVKKTKDFLVTRRSSDWEILKVTASVVSWDNNTARVIVGDAVMTTTVELSGKETESTLVMTFTDTPAEETVTMDDGYLWHPAWVIMWQSSDRPSTNATATSASTTATPLGPTEPPETNYTQNGLSGGAIAGIVVGVLAAFGLGLMMGLLVRRRRQKPVEVSGAREQPIWVQQGNFGGQTGPEQRPNGTLALEMAYAVEGESAARPSHQQTRPWLAFLGSQGRRDM